MKENAKSSLPGIPTLLGLLVLGLGVIAMFITGATDKQPAYMGVAALLGFVLMFLMAGLYKLEPNQSAVLSLFGKYVGSEGQRPALEQPLLQQAQGVAAHPQLRKQPP